MRRTFRQPLVGKRVRELREQGGLSRAQLSAATRVDAGAIIRLERGDDVRLSTYLPIIGYFLERNVETWLVAERMLLLPDEPRAQVRKLVDWLVGFDHERETPG